MSDHHDVRAFDSRFISFFWTRKDKLLESHRHVHERITIDSGRDTIHRKGEILVSLERSSERLSYISHTDQRAQVCMCWLV